MQLNKPKINIHIQCECTLDSEEYESNCVNKMFPDWMNVSISMKLVQHSTQLGTKTIHKSIANSNTRVHSSPEENTTESATISEACAHTICVCSCFLFVVKPFKLCKWRCRRPSLPSSMRYHCQTASTLCIEPVSGVIDATPLTGQTKHRPWICAPPHVRGKRRTADVGGFNTITIRSDNEHHVRPPHVCVYRIRVNSSPIALHMSAEQPPHRWWRWRSVRTYEVGRVPFAQRRTTWRRTACRAFQSTSRIRVGRAFSVASRYSACAVSHPDR